MAGISFGGIASGLPPNIVDQLMEAERIPVKNVESRKAKSESKLKLVSELETKLRGITDSLKDLGGIKGFTDYKLNSGDPNIVQGAVDPNGVTKGSWNIEVMKLANKAAVISNGFPDKTKTEIGVGYFKFKTSEGTKEVYINGNNNTLDGAAKAINAAGIGIQASVLNDKSDPSSPYRLMLSGAGVGSESTVEFPTLYFLDGDQDFYFDKERKAENGTVKIDGFEMEIGDNTLNDAIPGVALELKQAAPGRVVNVSVKEDQQVVAGKVKKFVDAANEVLGFIQKQQALNEKTDTSSTLGGDSLLRSVENDLRRVLQDPQYGVGTEINRLSQLGISFNRQGMLTYDEDKFNSTVMKHTGDVQRFLAGDGLNVGFIPSIRRIVGGMVDGAFGPIGNRKRGLQTQIQQADQRIEGMERRLQQREVTLKNQFANLEEKMSRIKSQGAMLQGKLGGDVGLGGKG